VPFQASPSTLGERIRRWRVADPLRVLKPCALHDGGPVSHESSAVTGGIPGGLAGLRFLHRHPGLARFSEPVIEGPLPVWHIPTAKLAEAVDTLLKEQQAFEAAERNGAASSAAAGASSAPASGSALLLPSDLIAYAGWAEWYPGQLESELRRGSWLLAQGSAAHVFTGETGAPDIDALFAASKRRKNNAKAAASMAQAAASAAAESGAVKEAELESSANSAADAAAPSPPLAPLPSPVRLARPFTLSRVWSHGLHVHGGECRHWAYWPPPGSEADTPAAQQALLHELLKGRE